ncbi:MAG TPA: hypothetical protein VH306_01685 [Gaiellaceae bacterium]|jgi:hypothetical protein
MASGRTRGKGAAEPLQTSLAFLVLAAAGAALVLALGALVAGAGSRVAALAFLSTLFFGLAADRRSQVAVDWIRRHRSAQ